MGRFPTYWVDRNKPDGDKAFPSEGESIYVAELLVPMPRYMRSRMPSDVGVRRRDSDNSLEPFSQHSRAGRLQPENRAILGEPHMRSICGDSSRTLATQSLSGKLVTWKRR